MSVTLNDLQVQYAVAHASDEHPLRGTQLANRLCTMLINTAMAIVAFIAYARAPEAERAGVLGTLVLALGVIHTARVIADVTLLGLTACIDVDPVVFAMLQCSGTVAFSICSIVINTWLVAEAWGSVCDELTGLLCSFTTFLFWFGLVGLVLLPISMIVACIGLIAKKKEINSKNSTDYDNVQRAYLKAEHAALQPPLARTRELVRPFKQGPNQLERGGRTSPPWL